VAAAAEQVASAAHGPLCLVHNAAMHPSDSFGDAPALAAALSVNVVAPSLLSSVLLKSAVPGSSVIFIGSTLSEKAVSGCMSYVVSKHAQVGLMRAAVQDLFGRGIHTAVICPGFADTEMLRSHLGGDAGIADAGVLKMVSFGRLVQASEVADIVEMVARSPAVNGAVIHCNLGQRES